ncbi:hypothetical protein [Oceanispirochaeta sp.]|jgi:hypothetical protein|nr:hypothetical protein [Oceanispirochaeta sp.]MDA3956882.1 hypothetical protein [Oceanispirochaeta sp.]
MIPDPPWKTDNLEFFENEEIQETPDEIRERQFNEYSDKKDLDWIEEFR